MTGIATCSVGHFQAVGQRLPNGPPDAHPAGSAGDALAAGPEIAPGLEGDEEAHGDGPVAGGALIAGGQAGCLAFSANTSG